MKVTVCFGNVRVVVPCGDGDILVKDLIREATLRYKKAVGKGADSWVSVHNLQSQGGGILDPDDRLSDVVDDREQILASFEDRDGAHLHGGGDGASGSSVGTGSPDIFHDGDGHKYPHPYPVRPTDIEVTGEQIASTIPVLQVRRGSEPTLAPLPHTASNLLQSSAHTKRWSAAPVIMDQPLNAAAAATANSGYGSPSDWSEMAAAIGARDDLEEDGGGGGGGFRRRDGSSRLSVQFLGMDGSGYRWAEAAERIAARNHITTSLPREGRRKEPLGQANSSPSPSAGDSGELIVIRNEPGPLGIHVIPDYDTLGRERGLLVKGIEPGGRIDRDGRLAKYDRVIEINGENLINMPFQRVQELFKLSLTSSELRLKVIKSSGLEGLRKPPPPVYPKFPDDKENVSMVECEQKQSTNTKVATVSPTKKVPAISKNLKGLLTANTRKIGRKIEIELTKGPHGLGFSITTRDNPAGGKCPIYIKNINAMGPAIEDGRLKIGDRLLEVNSVEMTGKTQNEAVALLKSLPLGSKVRIVVSRQEDVIENPLPRIIAVEPAEERDDEMPPSVPPLPQSHLQALRINRSPEKGTPSSSSVAEIVSRFQEAFNGRPSPPEHIDESMVFPWKHREIITLNIPVYDTEKAGLGISVKGKTSGSKDLGIFIKGVMCGGAASRDNRLRTNDQLLNVNGISLLQQSNSDAMETLKNAIPHTEGPVPGHITLTIARRVSPPGSSKNDNLSNSNNTSLSSSANELDEKSADSVDNSGQSGHSGHSGASGGSTNTVIFNPQNGGLEKSPSTGQFINNMHTWNPVLEKLTGNNHKQGQLRNESYYKATHDTWSSSMLGNSSFGNTTSTIVNRANNEPILIEDEYGSRVINQPNQQINVHITNKPTPTSSTSIPTTPTTGLFASSAVNSQAANVVRRVEHELPDSKASLSGSSHSNSAVCARDGSTSTGGGDKSSETSTQTTVQTIDATYASQLSLENPQGFSRDAFGRQSMSEKRHATLDAKSTDTYQRSKKIREERRNKETNLVRVGSVESVISVNRSSEHAEQADKLGQLGPSLGMKKSSSLESLQTMVQEIQMKEECDPAYSYRGPSGALKVIRGRGCEESFRAAVVDPNHRSEIGAKKHWLVDGPMENEREIDGFNNVRGAPRQSSLNAALDNKNKLAKKKPSILKGIGSMFRFGKHRKMDFTEPLQHYHPINEFDPNSNIQLQPKVESNNQNPSDKSQEQKPPSVHHHQQSMKPIHQQQNSQSSLHHNPQPHSPHHHPHHIQNQANVHHQHQNSHPQVQKSQNQAHGPHHDQGSVNHAQQREAQIRREPIYQRHGYPHRQPDQVIPENAVTSNPKYRQASSEHRKNERDLYKQRTTRYYQNEERDLYDHCHSNRAEVPNQFTEYGRPGSRSGIIDSVPFTHYVNYNDLQNHISRKDPLSDSQIVQMRLQVQQQRLKVEEESRKQHQYHSQRQTRPDSQLRPVSNYYEYESVQSVLNSRTARQIPGAPPGYQDANSNSLPRNQPQVQQTRHLASGSRGRGPFVTQVTIGEHQQQNGTKV